MKFVETSFKKVFAVMSLTAMTACGGGDGMPVAQLPEIDTSNPLLAEWDTPFQTPPFDRIRVADYKPAFETAIACSRAEVEAIVNNPAKPTFRNTIEALERQGELLGRVSGLFFNLLEADATDEMQQLALEIQPALSELSNDISLNPELFARVKYVYEHPGRGLSQEQKRLLENTYKGFARSGADLSPEKKELYRQYTTELDSLTLQFGQNVLAATNAYALHITDPAVVAELPDFAREAFAADAAARNVKGWVVTLQAPSYVPFMTYSSNRELKEQLWKAYNSRCLGGQFDNTAIAKRIAELRLRIANLLGYETYADYSLEEQMAGSRQRVEEFLQELLDKTRDHARGEYKMMNDYAASLGLQGQLMPWDWNFYSEKYKKEHYALSDEQVKPYFQLDSVRNGIFRLANKLYGIQFRPAPEVTTYHPDVTAYDVTDADGSHLAVLYLDFFPRASKRGGAWMTEFRGVKCENGVETRPLVSLVMNFTKPTDEKPALLTFQEVSTFLHEFGHALHGMFAEGEYESLNSPNVYRDFVELPSQIMENWATQKDFLDMWAVHYKTGEPIPAELVDRIEEAQHYLAAYANVRQLSFGLTDMAWHTLTEPYEGDVAEFEARAMAEAQILPPVANTALTPSYTHVFAGGYAAGYYGYKWAEVLEADAFSLFREKGIFNREVAQSFRDHILSQGDHDHPMKLYVAFRGHEPGTEALIEKMGLGDEK